MSPPRRYRSDELRSRRERRRRAQRRRRRAVLLVLAGAGAAGLTAALVDESRVVSELRGAPEAAAADDQAPTATTARVSRKPAKQAKRKRKLAALRPARVRLAAVGDIALHGAPPPGLLASASRLLRGDVVIGNLEGTLATGGTSKCARPEQPSERPKKKKKEVEPAPRTCFAFRAPPAYAAELRRAGLTVLNLANNHSADFGWQGQTETVAALGAAKLGVTGFGTSPYLRRVGRVRVAVLGFAPRMPGWDLLDVPAAAASVRRAARRADVVVVTMHAGAEGATADRVRPGGETYVGEPRGDVVAFAHAAVDAGADLVVGHGPHVLRGLEWYRGRLVAYSLGNFATNGELNIAGPGAVGAVLRATLRGDGTWAGGRLDAVRLARPGAPAPDPAGEAHAVVRRLSQADFGRRAARLAPGGRIHPPRGR